jgi:hypothetical protein
MTVDKFPFLKALCVIGVYVVLLIILSGCSVTIYKNGKPTFFNENSD